MKVLTHDGLFHADEVFETARLQLIYGAGNVEIIRTRDKEIIAAALLDKDTFVLDNGGVYDPEMNNYDHHQDFTLPATCLLVMRHITNAVDDISIEIDNDLKKSLLQAISDWDINANDIVNKFNQEFPGVKTVSHLINDFNVDPFNADAQMAAFHEAVKFARGIIERTMQNTLRKIGARALYDTHELTTNNIPVWHTFCATWKEKGEFNYAIQPNPQGYALLTTNSSTHPIPDVDEIVKIAPDVIFVHPGRFIAIFKTLDEIVEVAETLL